MSMLQVSEEDIDSYEAEYRGSEQEAAELLDLYTRFKGDMEVVRPLPLQLPMRLIVSYKPMQALCPHCSTTSCRHVLKKP